MDATTLGVVGAFASAVVVGVVAFYGHRVQSRTGLVTGYSSLTDQLQEEREDLRKEREDLRKQITELRTELSAERAARCAVEAESSALRAQVIALGGAP